MLRRRGFLFNILCRNRERATTWLSQIVWLPITPLCSGCSTIRKGLDYFASLSEGVLGFPFGGPIPGSAFFRGWDV